MKLYEIIDKQTIAPNVTQFVINAPDIARKRKAGQFVIIRSNNDSERIPLTIADSEPVQGAITLVSQGVGKSTLELAQKKIGDKINDVAGPLGSATHIEKLGTVVCIGGGIGVAPLFPITQAMKEAGNKIISILGARSKDLIIFEDKMATFSDNQIIMTDDGSYGEKGFVTNALQSIIDSCEKIDMVIAIGPAIMMKMVSQLTQKFDISTVVSLNTIMIDGTGMCGGCRVTIGDQTKFVCVDGPEFDGHLVNWDEMLKRQTMYQDHECRTLKTFQESTNANS